MIEWLLWVNLAWIVGHELDAIKQAEWRFFAQAFTVSDEVAYQVFTLLHVPLLVWVLWAMPSQLFQVGFSIFMIAHAIVHYLLRKHPLVNFRDWLSLLMIYAPVPTSILHLFLMYTG